MTRDRLLGAALAATLAVLTGPPCSCAPAAAQSSVRAIPADAIVETAGLNLHLAYSDTPYADTPRVLAAVRALGVRHVRDGVGRPDDPKFPPLLAQVAANGLRPTWLLHADWGVTPADAPAIARLAGPTLDALEAPNEPDVAGLAYRDLPLPQAVRAYHADTVAALAQDPATRDVPVLPSALAHPESHRLLGLVPGAPFANMHAYPGGHGPTHGLDHRWIPLVRLSVPDAPLLASETGYHNATAAPVGPLQPGVSERAAARYLPRLLLEYVARGARRAYLYELLDERLEPACQDPEAHFGLLRADFTPKPAYEALRNTLLLLADPGPAFAAGALAYSLAGADASVRQLLLQKRDGSFWLALWRDLEVYDLASRHDLDPPALAVSLRVASPLARADVYRPGAGTAPRRTIAAPAALRLDVPAELVLVALTPR